MRKKLLIIVPSVIIILALIPFIDGYFFKQIYLDQVQMVHQLALERQNVDITVSEYHLGWLESSAVLTISTKEQMATPQEKIPPMVMTVHSTIHHGPIVTDSISGGMTIAYASVMSSVDLPEALKKIVPINTQGFMQVNSMVPLSGKTWRNHFSIPPMNVKDKVKWDGITGDTVIVSDNQMPIKVNGTVTFGRFTTTADPQMPFIPEVVISPFIYTIDAMRDASGTWNGSSKLTNSGLSAKWQDDRSFTAGNLVVTSTYGASDNYYHLSQQATLDGLTLPKPFPIESINQINQTVSLDHLDVMGVKNYLEMMRSPTFNPEDTKALTDSMLKVLTPTTSLHGTFSMNTNLGASQAELMLTFQAVPKTEQEFLNDINLDFKARAAVSLVDSITIKYFASMTPVTALPSTTGATQSATETMQPTTVDPFVETIGALIQNQKITSDQSLSLMDMESQHLSATDLDKKLTDMKLDPDTMSRLESSYAKAMATQKSPDQTNPQPLAPLPENANDPNAQAKAFIDSLIQQGFIVKDNSDYVIQFTKKGTVFNLNGKDVSTQFNGMMQSTMPAPTPASQTSPAMP